MTIEARFTEAIKPPNLYPIGKKAATAVLGPLLDNTELAWEDYVGLREPVLEEANPYANGYLTGFAQGLTGDEALWFKLGVVLAHDILTERAEGIIPVLTMEFVQNYDYSREERLDEIYGIYPKSRDRGKDKEEEITRGLFAAIEKEAYEVLDSITTEDTSVYDTQILTGFVAAYFLFREGLSDPLNWESQNI